MKTQARLRLRKPEERELTMPRINGKPFRCLCGANVFMKQGNVFTCNACGALWAGS